MKNQQVDVIMRLKDKNFLWNAVVYHKDAKNINTELKRQ